MIALARRSPAAAAAVTRGRRARPIAAERRADRAAAGGRVESARARPPISCRAPEDDMV